MKKILFQKILCVVMDVNKNYCGDHFVITQTSNYYVIHLTIMLHINYISINHFSTMCTYKYNRYYWYTSRVEVSFVTEISICSKVCETKCRVSVKTLLVSQLVQSVTCVQLFPTLWTTARQASQSITNSQSLSKLISIASVIPFNYLILGCPIGLPLHSFLV